VATTLINDFEPSALNNRGEVLYAADLDGLVDPISGLNGEGVFLRSRDGETTRLIGATEPAPGGGTYGAGVFSVSSLNEAGDAAISFMLSPFLFPFGMNAGTFRYSHVTHAVTPVVLPFVTPAPGGGVFQGTVFFPHLNNRGDLLFDGLVLTDMGVHISGEEYTGIGQGIYKADRLGRISSVVAPGDSAPGGGRFDFAANPWINDGGDIAFIGHVAGDLAQVPGNPPQSILISALSNGYVKDGVTGRITEFAHAGSPIPASAGGGVFRQILSTQINNAGDVLFVSDLTPAPDALKSAGLFRYSRGAITSIARPGDAMPGGGHVVTISIVGGNASLNNAGDIIFNGTLDTDENGDQLPDQGMYLWSRGQLSLFARTGTVLPGVGTVRSFVPPQGTVIPPPEVFVPNSGAINNDSGQVLFSALLTNGEYVLLLSTPSGGGPFLWIVTGGPNEVAAGSTGSLPQDLAILLTGELERFSGSFEQHQTPTPSDQGARSQSLPLPTIANKLVAPEPAVVPATSPHTSQSEIDQFFTLWPDLLSGSAV
jgi:hypothetical protein